jgi:HAD superfamily hydrolase (TIGR01509 family)
MAGAGSAATAGAGAAAAPPPGAGAPALARAVIWDLDGTLIDTESLSTDAINMVLAPYGVRCDIALKREIVGTRRDWWTAHVVERLGLTGALDPAALGAGWDEACATLMPTARLMPGVEALTAALAAAGVPQAIATSSTRPAVKLAPHPGVASRMSVVVTGDAVARGKPAPDIFLEAAARLGIPPSACVVVEDSPLGIRGAAAAGMAAVAVPDGAVGIAHEDFTRAGADAVLPTLEGVAWEALLAVPRRERAAE